MNLNKYEKQEKEYLKMEKRYNELWDEILKLPLIPLPTPFQKGWEITQKLRDDIERRKDADEIKAAIKIGYYPTRYTEKERDVKLIRSGKKNYVITVKKEKVYVDLRLSKRVVLEKEYDALPDKIKKYFYLDTIHEAYTKYGRRYYCVNIPDYYLVLKAKPNILTHYRQKGGELEKEYQFLRDKLWEYWNKKFAYSKSYPKNKDRSKTRDKIKKFLKGEIDDISVEKTPLTYDY